MHGIGLTSGEVRTMRAREFFERMADMRGHVRELADTIAKARASAGLHGRSSGMSVAGGQRADPNRALEWLIDSGIEREHAESVARLDAMERVAASILYGRDGHGGLAKARSPQDADIIFCRYVRGMRWTDIARDVARPDSACPSKWCEMRARRAMDYVDRVGAAVLIDA